MPIFLNSEIERTKILTELVKTAMDKAIAAKYECNIEAHFEEIPIGDTSRICPRIVVSLRRGFPNA